MLARAALLVTIGAGHRPAIAGATTPPREYRITGVAVSTRDGAPVPYCRISAHAALPGDTNATPPPRPDRPGPRGQSLPGPRAVGGPALPIEATADSSGRFSLSIPGPGAWRIAATARGFRSQSYDEHEGFYSAVVLTDTAPAFNLAFRLKPDSVLTGLIFDEAGEPVESAQVMAELVAPTAAERARPQVRGRAAAAGRTDDRGRYEIGGLEPGSYRIRVQAQPWYASGANGNQQVRFSTNVAAPATPDPSLDVVYPITWYPGSDDEAMAETIKLGDGEQRQVDFHLAAIPATHLKIPRSENPNPPVAGEQRNRQQFRPVTVTRVGTDSAFGFQQVNVNRGGQSELDFGGLSPGTYDIRIPSADGKISEVRQIVIHPGSQRVLTLEDAKPLVRVQVRLDGLPNNQNATVEFLDSETGARISSQSQSRGREGFQPGALGDKPPPDESDAASRVVMLPPHAFSVQVYSTAGLYMTGMEAEGARVTGRMVTISDPATVTLHLADKHASIDGFAKIDGHPAAGAMVLLVPATFGTVGDLNIIHRDETNTDGSFRMAAVPPSQYILVVIDHGWGVDWRDPATLGQYLLHGTPVDLRTAPEAHQEVVAVPPA